MGIMPNGLVWTFCATSAISRQATRPWANSSSRWEYTSRAFADLRTVDSTVFDTYAQACRERGLWPMISIGTTHSQKQQSPIVLTKFATCLPSCFICAKFPIPFVYRNSTRKRWPKNSYGQFADAQTTTHCRKLTHFSTELYCLP